MLEAGARGFVVKALSPPTCFRQPMPYLQKPFCVPGIHRAMQARSMAMQITSSKFAVFL